MLVISEDSIGWHWPKYPFLDFLLLLDSIRSSRPFKDSDEQDWKYDSSSRVPAL
jgi:hypothetical protein